METERIGSFLKEKKWGSHIRLKISSVFDNEEAICALGKSHFGIILGVESRMSWDEKQMKLIKPDEYIFSNWMRRG